MTTQELKKLAEELEAERKEIDIRNKYQSQIYGLLHLKKVEAFRIKQDKLSKEGRCVWCGKPLARGFIEMFKVGVCRTNCNY